MQKIRYSDSIDIRYVNTEKFTRNLISVNFILPLDRNPSENALLSGVMRAGNATYKNQTEINKFLEENYGATFSSAVVKIGENQIVRFSTSFIADKYALDNASVADNMIGFLVDMISNPLITDGGFDKDIMRTESNNLIDRIKRRINHKAGYAIGKCIEVMCADELYSIDELGQPEEISAITPNELYDAYKKLMRESKVLIVGSGAFDSGRLTDLAEKLFADTRTGEVTPTLFVESAEDVTDITAEMAVNQSILCLGFRLGSKSYTDNRFAYMMLNAVYGASPISYLFMNVREKLSLCYFCSSSLNTQKGLLLVYAGISKENKQKAYDEIIRQLDRIKGGDISEEDMDGARKMLVNQYLTVTDELFSSDSYYLNSYMGNQEISKEEFIEGINSVTAEDIKTCAQKLSLDTVYFLTSPDDLKDGE